MFHITKDTDNPNRKIVLDISNVTIQNVGIYSGLGSVISLEDEKAVVKMNKVTLLDNLGNAILNNAGYVELNSVTFVAPTDPTKNINSVSNSANQKDASGNVVQGIYAKQSEFDVSVFNAGLFKSEVSSFYSSITNNGTMIFVGKGNRFAALDENNPISLAATKGNGALDILSGASLIIGKGASIASNQIVTIRNGAELSLDGGTLNLDNNDVFEAGGVLSSKSENSALTTLNYDVAPTLTTPRPIYGKDGMQFERGSLDFDSGTINIGVTQGATLYVTELDTIAEAVVLNLNRADSVLEVYNHHDEEVAMYINIGKVADGADSWNDGTISLHNSTLIMTPIDPTDKDNSQFRFATQILYGDETSIFKNIDSSISIANSQKSGFFGEYIQEGNNASTTIYATGSFWGYKKETNDDGVTTVSVAKKSIKGGTVDIICSSALENNETVSNIANCFIIF